VPRLLNPFTNPNGYLAAAGAVLAAAVMVTNAVHRHGIVDPTVIVAAVAAVGTLFARQQVTPVKDPKDGNGNPLVPAPRVLPVTPAPAVLPVPDPKAP
jgi:hypothetical protein